MQGRPAFSAGACPGSAAVLAVAGPCAWPGQRSRGPCAGCLWRCTGSMGSPRYGRISSCSGEAAALRAQQLAPEQYHPLVMRCDDLGVRILPFDDPDYPLAFSRIPDMPLVLYCTGDPLWLNEPGAVGIVGDRKAYRIRSERSGGHWRGTGPKRRFDRQRPCGRAGQRRAPRCCQKQLPYHCCDGRAHRPHLSCGQCGAAAQDRAEGLRDQ